MDLCAEGEGESDGEPLLRRVAAGRCGAVSVEQARNAPVVQGEATFPTCT